MRFLGWFRKPKIKVYNTPLISYDDFINAFGQLKGHGFKYVVNEWGIRLRKDGHSFCPITAVYYDKTNDYITLGNPELAANKLRLGNYCDIVRAADYYISSDPDIIKLRERMLKVLE